MKKVIYSLLKRALYGCIKSAWKHLSGNLLKRGYTLNPYDTCVANKMINVAQFTVIWHVDDIKMSYQSEKVLDAEVAWLETIYGPLVGGKGDEHTYLGMDLKFNNQKVEVTMIPYLQEIVNKFPYELEKLATTLAIPHLFEASDTSKILPKEQQKVFHHTVAKTLQAALRARPDLLTALSFLTCRVKEPDQDDLKSWCE
jgi:hypothetical protein